MKHKKVTLSAVVITKNEEKRIAQCLKSLSFADEILVVDNQSSDETVKIARDHNARVVTYNGQDFSALRNIGKNQVQGTWILYVDADEIVTEKLREEIKRVTSYELGVKNKRESQSINAYYIKRRNFYLGYEWPVQDRMQRLFIRDKLIRWEGKLHETAIIDGMMGELKEPLIHNTHRTLEEMVEKTNEWSDEEALLRFRAHHPHISWWRLLRVMMTGFFQSFIKQGGFRAGTVGWIESMYQAFSMFITYAKLWEMQEHSS